MKKALLAVFSIALILSVVGIQKNNLVHANFVPQPPTVSIIIRPDGSIDQPTELLCQNQSIYTLTQNLEGNLTYTYYIEIQKTKITLDGAMHIVSNGNVAIVLNNTNNVTIKNLQITNFVNAIVLINSSKNSLFENILSGNSFGIWLNENSNDNTITQNKLTANSQWSIRIRNSYNNIIYNNIIQGKIEQGIVMPSCGFTIDNSSKNNITSNSLTDLTLGTLLTNATNNYIYNNSFTNVYEELKIDETSTNIPPTPSPTVKPTSTPTTLPTQTQTPSPSPSVSPTSSPTLSPTPSPTIPEYPIWIIPSVFLAIMLGAILTIRKKKSINKSFLPIIK